MSNLDKINAFVESKREEMIETYKEVVNLESYHSDVIGVRNVAYRFMELFEAEGFKCELTHVGSDFSGPMLTGILGEDRPGKPIIFSGHMDTVHPTGKFGPNPFRIEDGKVYGPGVLDMKGGIVIALYAVKALNAIGYDKHPIKIIFAPDEEKLHEGANTAQLFLEAAKGGECAFNMETGLLTNDICISRRGKTEAKISVEGVSVHAGNDFYSGRNAIEELCFKVLEVRKLTSEENGTTASTGLISGGIASGTIPGHAECKIDLRSSTVPAMEAMKKKLEEICAKTYIEGTTTTLEFTQEMLPFEYNEGVGKLAAFVQKVAKEDGFADMPLKKIGGSSDAAYITLAGVPAICSCGIQGQFNHTEKEYAVLESLFTRTKLWADVIDHMA